MSRVVIRIIGVTVFQVLLLAAVSLQAQIFSPYSDFEAMTPAELETLQVKVSWVSSQNSPLPVVAFTSDSNPLDLSLFVSYRRSQFSYSNDSSGLLLSFTATTTELQGLIANIGTLPAVTAGGVDAEARISFSLQNLQPSEKGFEAVLDMTNAASLFDKLRLSFPSNADAHKQISRLACILNLLEAEQPTDVSTDVSVAFSGFRQDRVRGEYVSTVTVTNTSGSAIGGPISLVLRLPINIELTNNDGQTCATSPSGLNYVNLPGGLGPGESSEVTLRFSNIGRRDIVPSLVMVLAGVGAR